MISPDFICLNSRSRSDLRGWGDVDEYAISGRDAGGRLGEERLNFVHEIKEDEESFEIATVGAVGGGAKDVDEDCRCIDLFRTRDSSATFDFGRRDIPGRSTSSGVPAGIDELCEGGEGSGEDDDGEDRGKP